MHPWPIIQQIRQIVSTIGVELFRADFLFEPLIAWFWWCSVISELTTQLAELSREDEGEDERRERRHHSWEAYFHAHACVTVCCVDPGPGVDGVPVQQQSERHSGWRDGSRQNHPNHRSHHLLDGAQETERPLRHHRPAVVSISHFSLASASSSNVCSERRSQKPEKCVKLCHPVIRFQIAALIRLPSLSQYWLWTTVVLAHQKARWLLHRMMRFPLIHLFRPFVSLVCKNGSRSHTSLAAPRPPVWKTKLLLFYRSKTLTQTHMGSMSSFWANKPLPNVTYGTFKTHLLKVGLSLQLFCFSNTTWQLFIIIFRHKTTVHTNQLKK